MMGTQTREKNRAENRARNQERKQTRNQERAQARNRIKDQPGNPSENLIRSPVKGIQAERGKGRPLTGLLVCLLMCLLLSALSGCQLALDQEGEAASQPDRLIGIYVTDEHLDLFDYERYFAEHGAELIDGNNGVIEASSEYENRLYAVLTKETLTGEDGSTSESFNYIFPGLTGHGFYAPLIQKELTGQENDYYGIYQDGAFSDLSSHISSTDQGTELTMEGILYVVASNDGETYQNTVWYVNPVYQAADGSVYVTSGQGIGGNWSDGVRMSQTLTDTYTASEGGQTEDWTDSFTIHIEGMSLPVGIEVVELDRDSNVIQRGYYLPGELPETYTPEKNTDCLLVITYGQNGDEESLSRELYDRQDDGFDTYAEQDGICIPRWIQLIWD